MKTLLFTAAAAVLLAHPVSANLITNGGFETGDFTGWAHVGGNVDGTNPYSGNFAAIFFLLVVTCSSPLRRHPARPAPLISFWPIPEPPFSTSRRQLGRRNHFYHRFGGGRLRPLPV